MIKFLDVVWRVAAVFVMPPLFVYCVAKVALWVACNWINSTANYTSY